MVSACVDQYGLMYIFPVHCLLGRRTRKSKSSAQRLHLIPTFVPVEFEECIILRCPAEHVRHVRSEKLEQPWSATSRPKSHLYVCLNSDLLHRQLRLSSPLACLCPSCNCNIPYCIIDHPTPLPPPHRDGILAYRHRQYPPRQPRHHEPTWLWECTGRKVGRDGTVVTCT